jgi:hypothetical protein
MMTENPHHHEAEDFDKTVSFESGQFAIVDAEVIKSLKDKIPLAENAVFVATKQSREGASPFRISAEYDDATLRRLTIEPAGGSPEEHAHQVEEGIQILGHESDPVKKKTSRISRIGGKSRPKSAERSERNKRYSGKGDQKPKLTKGKSPVEQRITQAVGIDGAKRDNYGQPMAKAKTKVEIECMDLLAKAKEGLLSEDYLNNLKHLIEIRQVLADIRDNDRVSGKSFDLVYETVQRLDNHWHKSACGWVENIETLINKGLLDV